MALDMRVKYAIALRRRAADLFGRGLVYRAVSTELEIPKRTAKGWLRRFRATGAEGLLDVGGPQYRYSFETKLAAAGAVVEEGATRSEAMARFGVKSEAPISRWVKAYREGGEEALRPKPKGRPRGSGVFSQVSLAEKSAPFFRVSARKFFGFRRRRAPSFLTCPA